MILNFAADEASSVPVAKTPPLMKKGSWKKKLVVQKLAKRKSLKQLASVQRPKGLDVAVTPKGLQHPTGSMSEVYHSAPPPSGMMRSGPHRRGAPTTRISSIFSKASKDDYNIQSAKGNEQEIEKEVDLSSLFSAQASSFEELALDPQLVAHLQAKMGLKQPTLIQSRTIPAFLQSTKDLMIQAQTGSGKSLAFLLPMIQSLLVSTQGTDREEGTHGLILAPTRELAKQLYSVLESLTLSAHGKLHKFVPGLLIGGEKKKSEKARLRKGLTLLVSTPGRLLDHLKTTECFNVSELKWMVLDEADHLLQLGFEQDLREIHKLILEKRVSQGSAEQTALRTLLCSATMTPSVEQLAQWILSKDSLFIQAAKDKEESAEKDASKKEVEPSTEHAQKEEEAMQIVPQQLVQSYAIVPAKLRLVTLLGLLRHWVLSMRSKQAQIIVFLSCCDSVDFYYDILSHGHLTAPPDDDDEEFGLNGHGQGFSTKNDDIPDRARAKLARDDFANPEKAKVTLARHRQTKEYSTGASTPHLPRTRLFKLHGNMPQIDRVTSYNGFKRQQESSILFCTDVAARGLDIPNVTHILQFDPPADVKDYIHRIGRTGRMGKTGSAFMFLLPSEQDYVSILSETHSLQVSEHKIVPVLQTFVDGYTPDLKVPKGSKEYEVKSTEVHMAFEQYLLRNPEVLRETLSYY